MDPKLLRIKGEILLVREKLDKAELTLRQTNAKLAELLGYLEAAERGEPLSDEASATLDIPKGSAWQMRILLRTRISGMIEQTKSERRAVERNIGAMREALESLYLCPDCGGSGTIVSGKKYERFEGGQIVPTLDSHACSLCRGSGRIAFDEDSSLND